MPEIFVPKPRLQRSPKIVKPGEVGAWEDSRGRWHYTLVHEPMISIGKPLPVKCFRCGKPHVFKKSGPMGGWKPPNRDKQQPGWLCPQC